jgi:hypothetical protein
LEAKIIVPIVGSVTVISLAIILVLIPIMIGKDPCTEVETPAGKFKFCQGKPPIPLEPSVPTNDTGLPLPPQPPTNTTKVMETVGGNTGDNQIPLNSISGNWNVQGQTRDGLQFLGSLTFAVNNQFSAVFNVNGYLQPVQYGTYRYSPSDGTLTLTYYGRDPDFYTVKDITKNSFSIEGSVGTATFVRV